MNSINKSFLYFLLYNYVKDSISLNDPIYVKNIKELLSEITHKHLDGDINESLSIVKQKVGPYTIITCPVFNDIIKTLYKKTYNTIPTRDQIMKFIIHVND